LEKPVDSGPNSQEIREVIRGGPAMAKHPKAPRLLTHEQIWTALDRLAERASLSPSGLAKRAGLDPTTFNKSKRITADGRERWPSTESLAKALAATDSSIDSFVQLIGDGQRPALSVPSIALAQAAEGGHFDETGRPAGKGWGEVALPSAEDEQAFALEVSGDALLPAYRDGDVLLLSPASAIRRGDRVAVKPREGEVVIGELKRRTAKALELDVLGAAPAERTLAAADVEWIARIVWVRQ
jgi:phage repressor protein C with HTH and peptisase S24 domain